MTNLWQFFTNTDEEAQQADVVQAKAFSLTKVVGVLAPVITAAGTWAVNQLELVSFSPGQVAAIIIAVIAFWAVITAADVMARGMATSAEKTANGRLHMVTFKHPVASRLENGTRDEKVTVVAFADADPPQFLVVHDPDKRATWEMSDKVELGVN
ncbi:hypothetical protein [Isoptericola sp. 178]|uniref:hypothetical protein n=1 Tax=Isoptericola sp. 178 TaxID=3064651 RepID=UPI0027135FF4|nr:hypothetical protein [Isoptericola sp. 178]MDO8143082.1 hypothetical protein [Isoptericola sp. 178]